MSVTDSTEHAPPVARCPRCIGPVERTELGHDRSRPAWWCDRCAVVVLDEHAVRMPVERERADLR